MKGYKCEAGYIGKKDEMRDAAKRLLKGDIDAKVDGSYASASAPQFLKKRLYKKGGHVKKNEGTELHIPPALKLKKPKHGKVEDKGDAFLPIHPKKKGKPMIGMHKKSPKLAHGTPMKVNKKVKAKNQPYDASMGQYLKKGGKTTKRGK